MEALIREDLRLHPGSSISDIVQRLPGIELKELRKFVYNMANEGVLKKKVPERIGCISLKASRW